ncbi:hypothetical protein [Aminipila sp.]|uniref:hypothetical protein n=1 Tax=Aminipila sp. TaxID=2060095 RepID=UPI00289ABF2A|nr:hypothetical protein [Aminipila sp.]
MKINIEDLYKFIPKEISDYPEFDAKALTFFGVCYDEESQIFDIPEGFDVNEAKAVVEAYLTIIFDCYVKSDKQGLKKIPTYILKKARKYNKFTAEFRGADDGTFDYCGNHLLDILGFIGEYLDSIKIQK